MEKGKGKSGEPGERRTRRSARSHSDVLLAPPTGQESAAQPGTPAGAEGAASQTAPLFVHDLTNEGLQTLSRLLDQLRSNSGATVLLAHHLSPDHQKQLTDFLVSDAARESSETIQKLQKELAWATELLKQRATEIARLGDDISNILAAARIPLVVLDGEMRIIHYSPAAAELLRLEPDVRGRKLVRLDLPILLSDLETAIAAVLHSGTPAAREIAEPSGRSIAIDIAPFMARENSVEGVVLTFRDIESEKRQEKLLKTYQVRDQQYHRVMHGILVTLDPEKNVMRINRAGSELFGRREEECIGRNWIDEFIPRKIAHVVSAILDRVLSGDVDDDYEYAVVAARGEEHDIAWRSVLLRDAAGKVTGILCSGYDLTVLQKSQSALRESEERLRLMMESVKEDEFFTMDSEGYIVSWFARPDPGKSFSAEEMMGKHFSMLYAPDEFQSGKPMRALDSAATHGRLEEVGSRVRKDGSRMKADIVILPIRNQEGAVSGYSQSTRYVRDHRSADESGDISFPFRLEPIYDKR
jgi:PAS domain S-box-containing protein